MSSRRYRITGVAGALAGAALVVVGATTVLACAIPTVTTHLSATTIAIGSSAYDTVTITTPANSADALKAGGSINYYVYANNNCTGKLADLTPAPNTVSKGSVPS